MSRKEKIFDSSIYMYKLQAIPFWGGGWLMYMKILMIKIYAGILTFGMGMYEHYKNFR